MKQHNLQEGGKMGGYEKVNPEQAGGVKNRKSGKRSEKQHLSL